MGKYKLASIVTLVAIAAAIILGGTAASGGFNGLLPGGQDASSTLGDAPKPTTLEAASEPSPSPKPTVVPFPTSAPQVTAAPPAAATAGAVVVASPSDCTITGPEHHSTVGGSFAIEGRCSFYGGGTIFLVIRDLHGNQDTGGPGPYWIQCKDELRLSGEFLCSGFTCVRDSQYELALVFPHQSAFQDYSTWLGEESDKSRWNLPEPFDWVGQRLAVISAHTLRPTPTQCVTTEDDK